MGQLFKGSTQAEPVENRERGIQARIENVIQHDQMRQERLLILPAYPTRSAEVKTLFSGGSASLKTSLERPPTLRHSGWDLTTLDQARFVRGEFARVINGNRKVVDLYRDGSLVFAGLANGDFLAWSDRSDIKLNPLALIEVVANFPRFYSLVLDDCRHKPTEVVFRVELRNLHLNERKSLLTPHAINTLNFRTNWEAKEAPEDSWARDLRVRTDSYNPDRVAYELVKELYVWFGHEVEVIRYTVEDAVGKRMLLRLPLPSGPLLPIVQLPKTSIRVVKYG